MDLVQYTELEDEHKADECEGVETNQKEGSPMMQEPHQRKVDHMVEKSNVYHRFLCPKKALGIPVRMRRAPSTPNPGSSLVSSRIWAVELVSAGSEVAVDVLVEDDRG